MTPVGDETVLRSRASISTVIARFATVNLPFILRWRRSRALMDRFIFPTSMARIFHGGRGSSHEGAQPSSFSMIFTTSVKVRISSSRLTDS